MKIKAVCEATGLTDRTVRYYIEEGLIAPFYTENYLGRKTFDFSDADIQVLNDIAVLRKFGFSIADIREMIQHPEQIIQISQQLQARKRGAIAEEQNLLQALQRLDESRAYTVSELAACLSEPVAEEPVLTEDAKLNAGKLLLRILRTAFRVGITWLPVVCCVLITGYGVRQYRYPAFDRTVAALLILALIPAGLMLLLPRAKKSFLGKKAVRIALAVLCAVSIPLSCILSVHAVAGSETTDFEDYLELDADCLAARNPIFQDLFPTVPRYFVNEKQLDGVWKPVYLDAQYYYHYSNSGIAYTYDICAEWPLREEKFEAEVARVTELFDSYATESGAISRSHTYEKIRQGSYECLAIYNGGELFEPVAGSYKYYIFAYDEENLKVRYICCASLEGGEDQPYYLTLDWE